jgi:hypothetical protein
MQRLAIDFVLVYACSNPQYHRSKRQQKAKTARAQACCARKTTPENDRPVGDAASSLSPVVIVVKCVASHGFNLRELAG